METLKTILTGFIIYGVLLAITGPIAEMRGGDAGAALAYGAVAYLFPSLLASHMIREALAR